MRIATWLIPAILAMAFAPAAASAQTAHHPLAKQAPSAPGPAVMPAASVAPCDATSIDSPPGKIWWAEERWRYQTDAAATAAYETLVNGGKGGSAWPDWFLPTPTTPNATPGVMAQPPVTILPVGTRFQMAMSSTQQDDLPGGWGTFDYISNVRQVRQFLAVTHVFKTDVNRVITYEVTRMLPVLIGPIGPQVDAETCTYSPGRWSQFNMLPAWDQRMSYLKIIEVRPIQ